MGVTGCVAQQEGENLFKKAPILDLVVGPDHIGNIGEIVDQKKSNTANLQNTKWQKLSTYKFPELPEQVQSHAPQAFVTIQKGCDNFCSFCIVPFTRGREKSREAADIITEVEKLAKAGVAEVTLLGQNVNSYGKRLQTPVSFAQLCKEVAKIEGIKRIRYTSPHPKDLSEEDMLNYRDLKELCPQLHFPLQSGSDEILHKMKRFYSFEEYLKKVEKIREMCPGIAIGTDMIVGFPGESEKDFLLTLEAVKTVGFDYMYPFAYSQRPKTIAAKWAETISEKEKKDRLNELIRVQEPITAQKNAQMVGKVEQVLVEGKSKKGETVFGRTGNFKIVHFEGEYEAGIFMDVKITSSLGHSLRGKALN